MNLSMSLDHRLVDGIDCARFVHEVKRILERADFPDLSTHKPEE
jgi:pyruvate/2-oxoglutarate dehydrogenase complex dihydrolipoamide acyltransferase (E2) component